MGPVIPGVEAIAFTERIGGRALQGLNLAILWLIRYGGSLFLQWSRSCDWLLTSIMPYFWNGFRHVGNCW